MEGSRPEYVFTRDFVDNNRINLQHYQWVQLFGYHIHPDIPIVGPQHRIADVGTGTGVWLADISTRLPASVQLDGLDISFKATPPPQWLPSNISLLEWDIKQPVPDHLIGQYDIVHIRLFIFVLLNEEVSGILAKLFKLLKPGGYLQWSETDISSVRITRAQPDSKVDATSRLVELSRSQDPRLSPTWVPRLAGLAEAAKFCEIKVDKRDPPGYLAFAMHECNLLLYEIYSRATGNKAYAQLLHELLPGVVEETRDGTITEATRWTIVARKPIS
ncbi:S-adenosyl-L-methionine-dependent methyltransferase [Xylariaceae sp. FL0255]|nr:S-adenosyl-L-methionine-dependent methyltransferase [Xylariaceae sp. FL0255]